MLLFTAYGYAHLHFCTALRGGDSLLFAADTALLGIDKVIAYHCNRFKRIPCYAGRKSIWLFQAHALRFRESIHCLRQAHAHRYAEHVP